MTGISSTGYPKSGSAVRPRRPSNGAPYLQADSRRKLTSIFFVFVFLLSSTGLLIPLLQDQGVISSSGAAGGSTVTQAIWLLVYAVTLVAAGLRWPRFLRTAIRDRLLLGVVCLALVSVLWSAAPGLTFERGVALVGTTLFGAYLATRCSPGEQLRLLAWALGISAWLSLLFALLLPSYGISSEAAFQGDWRGIFDHKNSLGSSMALSSLAFLILSFTSRGYRWIIWPTLAISLALLWLSDSKTALVVLVALLLLWPLYQVMRWRHTLVVPLMIVLVLVSTGVVALIARYTGTILSTLGRNPTLTGRTELWSALLDMIQAHPWLGYGYSAFWLGWEGPSAQIWLRTGSEVPAADNSYLELLLSVGYVGLILFVLGFVMVFARTVSYALRTRRAEGLWPLLFVTFLLFYSFTESVFLIQNDLFWILYVATALSTFTGSHARRGGLPRVPHQDPSPVLERTR